MNISLEQWWYIVFLLVLAGYAMLDGFDLGVGALHLFTREDKERRIFLSAIGPVWDGNEVWLVVAGGALFAGFPLAYAVIFSSFYDLLMILLVALIFRAVSIEFRSKVPSPRWRRFWDWSFSLGSIIATLSLGFILGNFVQGIPLDEHKRWIPSLQTYIHPYSLLVSLTTLALFSLHGSLYLLLKTTGDLHERLRRWAWKCFAAFLLCYILLTLSTALFMPHMLGKAYERPILMLLSVCTMGLIVAVGGALWRKRDSWAFISSCVCITCLLLVYAVGSYPFLLRASNDPSHSVTLFNAASSPGTLKKLLLVVCLGVPLVLGYTVHVYRVFRGKVSEDSLIY